MGTVITAATTALLLTLLSNYDFIAIQLDHRVRDFALDSLSEGCIRVLLAMFTHVVCVHD